MKGPLNKAGLSLFEKINHYEACMLTDFIEDKSKFSLIAVKDAYTDFPNSEDFITELSDGTRVLSKVPLEIDKGWQKWIGSLRYEEFEKANLVFVYSEKSDNPEILDATHNRLSNKLIQLFNILQLDDVLEYQVSNLIIGSYYDNRFEIRQMAKLPQFFWSKGYSPQPLVQNRIERAILLREGLNQIDSIADSFDRVIRGWNILIDGLQKNSGEERIHQFVRSLEALILPDVGKTKKQFIHRCQTFTSSNPDNSKILKEAFELRSMCEHLNDWKPVLDSYPEDTREKIAYLRTRQMEKLACFVYSKILENVLVRTNFITENAMQAFWKMQEEKRIEIWGDQIDLKTADIDTQ
jgi:hypothetical protein